MINFNPADITAFAAAFLAGVILGGIYFGALWLTLRQLPHRRRPGLFLVASLTGRLGILLIAFYLILISRHWIPLLASLIGFLIVRVLLIRRVKHRLDTQISHSRTEGSS